MFDKQIRFAKRKRFCLAVCGSRFAVCGVLLNKKSQQSNHQSLHQSRDLSNMAADWTQEAELTLVEMWPNLPCLYAVSSAEYSDRIAKDKAYQELRQGRSTSNPFYQSEIGHKPLKTRAIF